MTEEHCHSQRETHYLLHQWQLVIGRWLAIGLLNELLRDPKRHTIQNMLHEPLELPLTLKLRTKKVAGLGILMWRQELLHVWRQ